MINRLSDITDEAYCWATDTARNSICSFSRMDAASASNASADALTLIPSMRTALADLKLDHLYVLYPVDKTYALGKKVEVVHLAKFVKAK